jgi:hypothetical protein
MEMMMPKLVPVDLNDPKVYVEPPVEELIKEFYYKIDPTNSHDRILELFKIYFVDNEKFMHKYNKEAGKRARKALLELHHLCRQRRKEILSEYQGGKRII